MESLSDFKMIKQGEWMASACTQISSKIFKFEWFKGFSKIIGMPNGYSEAMITFTKILKPVFGYLRPGSYLSVIFVDDSNLQVSTERACLENIEVTVNLLIKFGFKIYEKKLVLKPTQELEFLGVFYRFLKKDYFYK